MLSVITISQIAVIYKYGTGNILIGRYYDVIIAFVLLRSLGIDRFFFYFENSVTILVKLVCCYGEFVSYFLCYVIYWFRYLYL